MYSIAPNSTYLGQRGQRSRSHRSVAFSNHIHCFTSVYHFRRFSALLRRGRL